MNIKIVVLLTSLSVVAMAGVKHVPRQTPSRVQSIQWTSMSEAQAPSPRIFHAGLWTGTEMIVWGGMSLDGAPLGDGGAYNPATNRWRTLSSANAPSARSEHSAVWTGDKMVIWGGCTNKYLEGPCMYTEGTKGDGAAYDPIQDTWTELPSGISEPRASHHAFAIDGKMLIFDGYPGVTNLFPGVWSYETAKRVWSKSDTEIHGMPLVKRQSTGAVLGGDKLYIWGGAMDDGKPRGRDTAFLNDGLIYDVKTRSWEAIPNNDAPPAGCFHPSTTWTGSEMVVFGGEPDPRYDGGCDTGGIYHPGRQSWRQTPLEGAPSKRFASSVVVQGTDSIVWGGKFQKLFHEGETYGDAFALNTETNQWRALRQENAPKDRAYHTTVWTGSEWLIWGGYTVSGEDWEFLNSGGRGVFE